MALDTTLFPPNVFLKYLRTVLDAAQSGLRLRPSLNIKLLPEWPKPTSQQRKSRFSQHYKPKSKKREAVAHDPTSLAQAVERGSLQESELLYNEGCKHSPLFLDADITNPIVSVRMAVLELAKLCDCGSPWMVLDSPAGFMNIRVVAIRKLHDRAPLFVVVFRLFGAFTDPAKAEGIAWRRRQVRTAPLDPKNPDWTSNVFKVNPLAGKILFQILWINGHLLRSDMGLISKCVGRGEGEYGVSILGPIGHIYQHSLLDIQPRFRCVVCQKTPVKECSGCYAVAYCSKECQGKNWSVHSREQCIPRFGMRWVTVRVSTLLCDPSRFGSPELIKVVERQSADTLDNYLSKPFVVRFTKSPSPDTQALEASLHPPSCTAMELLDVKRSLTFSLCRNHDPGQPFDVLEAEMQGPRGGHDGKKMYRWASRTGDWTYSICLDRVPPAALSGW
ncbi:uncharacterized protein BXZ73DRAFT_45726 [Epithele typhae]|uniref:uncharacterized protein n=1 Tax=Epithele typhae TaxID=378194 RepID=UPI002007E3D3|nr:uncharacterized protein BXZ73DRAFT_45726 [Epithele typhae]KAH9934578.1 hypothetical protein BXZ73DRAFT_45726 [Epithele typhae]